MRFKGAVLKFLFSLPVHKSSLLHLLQLVVSVKTVVNVRCSIRARTHVIRIVTMHVIKSLKQRFSSFLAMSFISPTAESFSSLEVVRAVVLRRLPSGRVAATLNTWKRFDFRRRSRAHVSHGRRRELGMRQRGHLARPFEQFLSRSIFAGKQVYLHRETLYLVLQCGVVALLLC